MYNYFIKTHNGIFNGKKATFNEWHHHCQEVRSEYLSNKTARQVDLDRMADTWSQRIIDEKKSSYDLQNKKDATDAKAKLLRDLEEIIDRKEQQLSKAMKSPGTEAVETLSLLSLRSNLTPGDIVAILPQVSSSLLGLQTLRDISIKNGIDFPKLPSVEEINASIGKVRDFAKSMLNSLDADEHGYMQRLFWTTEMPGIIQKEFDFLDNPLFLQIDSKDIGRINETGKETLAQDKPKTEYTRLTLNGTEYIDTIAREFGTTVEEIQKANPNTDLVHTCKGDVLLIPGQLVNPETGIGHVDHFSHEMEAVKFDE